MSIIDRIGIDIGPASQSPLRAPAAMRAGARIARLRFSLDGSSGIDEDVMRTARAAVDAARASRLRVLAVVDADLTVAPGGAAGEGVPPSVASAWGRELAANAGRLAELLGDDVAAWEVLPGPNWRGASGGEPRLTPQRWATLLAEVAAELHAGHASATVVAGALISDTEDDGVAYLRAAATAAGWRSAAGAPFDALGMQLAVLPEGGASEGEVAATVAERVQRLWRVGQSAIAGARQPQALWVTGVSWDAVYAGESAQARNLWTAFDTLTADPTVAAVIWTALVDQSARNGLYAGPSLDAGARRPAWTAFHDFATYARQISPVGAAVSWMDGTREEATPDGAATRAQGGGMSGTGAGLDAGVDASADSALDLTGEVIEGRLHADAVVEEPGNRGQGENDDGILDDSVHDDSGQLDTARDETAPSSDDADREDQADQTRGTPLGQADDERAGDHAPARGTIGGEGGTEGSRPSSSANGDEAGGEAAQGDVGQDADEASLRFRMPTIEEVLRGAGLSGSRLAAALAEIDARFGSREWLPPGDYEIDVPRAQSRGEAALPADSTDPDGVADGSQTGVQATAGTGAAVAPAHDTDAPPLTNQAVLSALYRAGGGTWALLERVGLDLSELVTRREAAYDGPELRAAPGLSEEERAAVARAIEAAGAST